MAGDIRDIGPPEPGGGSSDDGEKDRLVSIYTWGPTGLVARRGVSIHDGHWQEDDPETPEVNEAGWVPGQVNSMCDYVYLADGMGNVRGLVDSSGNVSLQVFDAFGNPQGSGGIPAEATYVDFRCNSDCDFGDMQDADPPRPHEPVERIQKGSFAWRGGEGSQTDRLSRSVHYHESTPQERVAEAFTRPSSGLVYMQARYYDPAVGRFTQLDPVRYGPETFATGQNNRWTYCANDPVNASDPSGLSPAMAALIGTLYGLIFSYGFYFGWNSGVSRPGATTATTTDNLCAITIDGGLFGVLAFLMGDVFVDYFIYVAFGGLTGAAFVVAAAAFSAGWMAGRYSAELLTLGPQDESPATGDEIMRGLDNDGQRRLSTLSGWIICKLHLNRLHPITCGKGAHPWNCAAGVNEKAA